MGSRTLRILVLSCCLASVWTGARAGDQGEAIEAVGPGTVNWTSGLVTAVGIGAPPPNAVNQAQARAMAERAAFSVAVRNLLETVKGVRVDSATLVENMVVSSDVVRTRVSGLVRGARKVKTEHQPDGGVEVTVALSLTGDLVDAVLPKEFGRLHSGARPVPAPAPPPPPAPAVTPAPPPAPPAVVPVLPAPAAPSVPPAAKPKEEPTPSPSPPPSAQSYTGLLVDARGLGVKPALAPRLLDEQGHELYAGNVLTRDQAVEAGVAGYARDLVAGSRQARVTDNPLIVRAVKASGNRSTDIVLDREGVKAIQQSEPTAQYLKQARVVVVYD